MISLDIIYYKFIDENTRPVPFCGWYENNGQIITNPPADFIKLLGYKPIVEDEYPELTADQDVEIYWVDDDESIKMSYRVITAEDITSDEALLIITGGESI